MTPARKATASPALGKFEGMPVVRSTLKVTKAGDGLSEALKLAPIPLHNGDEVYLVLQGKVQQVNHRPDSDDKTGESLVRQHTIVTEDVALVGEGDVGHLLEANADRVQILREEAEGVQRLPTGEMPDPDEGDG